MKKLTVLLMLGVAPLSASAADDFLEEAKSQYAAAAYEEALSTLARLESAPVTNAAVINKVELEQYRAFCFIALGRIPEAERAVASIVATDPRYVPSQSVASPKVLQLVYEMRRRELPGVARKLLEEGRTAFKEKQFARAQETFALLQHILDDPALKGRPDTEDLRVLADGFVVLAAAAAAPPPAPAPVAAPAEMPVRTTGAGLLEPPIAINQVLPEWVPPDQFAASRDYAGAVKVTIGVDGKVKAAAIEKATYPAYDARLLQVAKGWIYKPARRNGEAVETEKIIAVNLRRRN